jgi:hypothetical protein
VKVGDRVLLPVVVTSTMPDAHGLTVVAVADDVGQITGRDEIWVITRNLVEAPAETPGPSVFIAGHVRVLLGDAHLPDLVVNGYVLSDAEHRAVQDGRRTGHRVEVVV